MESAGHRVFEYALPTADAWPVITLVGILLSFPGNGPKPLIDGRREAAQARAQLCGGVMPFPTLPDWD